MSLHAQNGRVLFPDGQMDYLRFGTGKDVLIMLPGLGDGLRSSYGLALPTAILYRMYAKDYTVYMFSRKNRMPQGCTTADMARHVAQACLEHNALKKLPSITAPTLVIGGGQDATLGSEAAAEIAAAIPGAQLRLFPQWGHGLYEEAPEFNREVLEFLR